MKLTVTKSNISGSVDIPGSKSHTLRAVAIASLAGGESVIRRPLTASDTRSGLKAYGLLGARISESSDWTVTGTGGNPGVPNNVVDVGNSGTTLYIAMGSAGLINGTTVFTGDEQIRRRPAGPLIEALNGLGAEVESTRGNGMAPLTVKGPIKGGHIRLDGSKTSQYLSSLLINCPLAQGDTTIEVENLVEKPYVEMTLRWITEQGAVIENDSFQRFKIAGGQHYKPFNRTIAADFSSATFFLCAAAITGADLTLVGLDMNDTQGDKAVVKMLEQMGAEVEQLSNGLRVRGKELKGAELNLGDTPDALPAMAVTACFADGETRLVNVAQARLKETDRISVMRQELSKMGADIEELSDGLIVRKSRLSAADVHGHGDHRVIMALAVAGLALEGRTTVDTAEALSVTFPTFAELMRSIGANMKIC